VKSTVAPTKTAVVPTRPFIVPAKPVIAPATVPVKPVVASVKPVQQIADLNKKIVGKIELKTESKIEPKAELKIEPQTRLMTETKKVETKTVMPELKRPSTTNISPMPAVAQPIISTQISTQVDKLNNLLKRIDDDIIMDRFDKAKETYKEALLIYRPMRDSEKSKCYERFYATFKKLDDSLHQKSLHDILDKHLSESIQSHRPLTLKKPDVSGAAAESYISESSKIINTTTLPLILANDLETTRVYELIEESYFNIDNSHSDLAMLKYFKALEFYHKLSISDKKKLYSDLYGLFKRLSIAKKA